MTRYLAAVGDANDPKTWSGIPYFLLRAAKTQGLIEFGLKLDPYMDQNVRKIWYLKQILRGRWPSGFQYSNEFLESMWSGKRFAEKSSIINCFQLYPNSITHRTDISRWYYIDQTLQQMFDGYASDVSLSSSFRDEIVKREREQYRTAEGIIVHSRWCANDLERRYKIESGKIFKVVPGANLDEFKVRTILGNWRIEPHETLKLIFVGKDWKRKGLLSVRPERC
ncbi:glycosyltransferase family 4 protein [Methylocystis sp. ATCC 49242]|uniref:glycosyltransferase family 4 protein n=1 Tax=Methylocystis sp. ATCC 49242 TaxID=622637 RepID=UPI0001F86B1E|nr:glycosyltransferase family 4 protein [Methylocystis sp. ATCC 49242]